MNERILELLEKRSYAKLKEELIEMNPYDIACVLEEIPKEMLALLFRILPKEIAAETFVEMDADMQQHLIDSFNDNELKEVLSELYVDDAVAIIEEIKVSVSSKS